jgi:CMP-N-acetylneuraminic acid synthetase
MTILPKAIAIIPARGGSKGIPGKNLQTISGIPLIGRTIQAALNSDKVSRVYVTTDDSTIASVASSYGAVVISRPSSIAGDEAGSEAALLHALEIVEQLDAIPEDFVFLQCTSPFTTGEQIDLVLSALDEPLINSSFSVVPWHGFLWRADGKSINHSPSLPRPRRQDLEPCFLETGAIYAMKTLSFKYHQSRFCPPWKPIVIHNSGPEIDTHEDLLICRQLASWFNNQVLMP